MDLVVKLQLHVTTTTPRLTNTKQCHIKLISNCSCSRGEDPKYAPGKATALCGRPLPLHVYLLIADIGAYKYVSAHVNE